MFFLFQVKKKTMCTKLHTHTDILVRKKNLYQITSEKIYKANSNTSVYLQLTKVRGSTRVIFLIPKDLVIKCYSSFLDIYV